MQTAQNILLVLDNIIVATDLKNMLEHSGYHVKIYSPRREKSVESYLVNPPDIVIVDISEGELKSSLEFVKSVKKKRRCPVIHLVLENDSDYINEYIKPTIDGYIVKPISRQHLNDAVKRVLALNDQYTRSKN